MRTLTLLFHSLRMAASARRAPARRFKQRPDLRTALATAGADELRLTLDEKTALDAYAIDFEINGVKAKALCVADFPKFPMLATCERGKGIKDFIMDVRSWSLAQEPWF
jgi:hypothetical protein